MKNMKKLLFTLVSSALIATNVSALASCAFGGGDSTEGTTSDIVAYDGSAVTVTFYHTMGKDLRDVLDAYIPEFNAMYPNITIEHQQIGKWNDVRDQINKELTANNAPSIAYCYQDHVAGYNKAKAVLTLDDFIASTETVTKADGTTEIMGFTEAQIKDFVSVYYEEGRTYGDGKMYSLPYSKSTELLYYNKTYFDAKGYTPPTTWEQMETLCAQIKAEEPNNIPLGYDSEANWFITMCEQSGTPYTSAIGDHFLFNTPENQAFVNELSSWYDNGYVTTEEIFKTYTSVLFTEKDPSKARCYMCIGSSGGAKNQVPDQIKDPTTGKDVYPFEVGVTLIPQVDVNNPKVISQGPSLCLFKTSAQEQAAAWLFAKFLTTHVELQAAFSIASGYTPVINSVDQHPVYSAFLANANGSANLPASATKQCIAQKNAFFVSPAFDGSSAARDAVGELIQNCFVKKDIGNMTAADYIAKQFADAIDELEFDYS